MQSSLSDSLTRVARSLRWLLLLAMLVMAAVNAWVWIYGKGSHGHDWINMVATWSQPFDAHPWTAMTALSLVSLALLWGFWRLWQLMGLFIVGEFFSVRAARKLRAFALSLVLAVLAGLLAAPLLLVIARQWEAVPDTARLTLSLDATDLLALLVAVLLWMVTAIMAEARRLAEDNAQIV